MSPPPLPANASRTPKRGLSTTAIVVICLSGTALVVALIGLALAAYWTRSSFQRQPNRARELGAVQQAASDETRLTPARVGAGESEPGVTYKNERMLDPVTQQPWSIHVLKIDRARTDLMFYSAHARNKVLGVSLLADQARAIPREVGQAIAAVNGDFYDRDNPTYAGDPRGLQIIRGEMISAPDTVCVWFDREGNPHLGEVKGLFYVTWADGKKTPFGLNQRRRGGATVLYTPTYGPSTRASGGREFILEKDGEGPWLPFQAGKSYRARVREVSSTGNTAISPSEMILSCSPEVLGELPETKPGDLLQISTSTMPDMSDVQMAIAGGPVLIDNGKAFSQETAPPSASANYSERSKYERHPRSAIGWSATHVFLVTVDGRQPGLSVGMKLAELAQYMRNLGCTEAMNLDGGKSAQMWMKGRIMNSPAQGEDTVANSVVVIRKIVGR